MRRPLRQALVHHRLREALEPEPVPGQGLNVSFHGVDGADLLAECPEIAASTGAACHAATREASGVLAAMSRSYEEARDAVRLSVGRTTMGQEVEQAAQILARAWQRVTAA